MVDKPIKILHIFGRMQRGGAEMRTLDLMRHIDRTRYQFHFCALSGLPGELDNEVSQLGGQVHLLALDHRFPHRFRQLLREQHYAVVQAHVHFFSGYILRLAAKENVPVRITHFRITDDGQGNSIRRRMQRRVMRDWIDVHSTHILAVSQGAMVIPWGSKWCQDQRCQVIYNGFDVEEHLATVDRESVHQEFSLPTTSRLFIHVGRMDEQKNHKRLINIFAEIAKEDPAAYLLLVGRGGNDIERFVRARATECSIVDRVIFTGVRSDVRRLLGAADIMLFPSLREGLPGAVLEAAAVGTPVLASDVPGVVEIAQHLPFVRYLPLHASDQEWAKHALTLHSESIKPGVREVAREAFVKSVFTIEQCAKAHYAVWGAAL